MNSFAHSRLGLEVFCGHPAERGQNGGHDPNAKAPVIHSIPRLRLTSIPGEQDLEGNGQSRRKLARNYKSLKTCLAVVRGLHEATIKNLVRRGSFIRAKSHLRRVRFC